MPAFEEALERKTVSSFMARKGGWHDIPLVTVARAEMAAVWPHIIHQLPTTQGPKIQNDDGTFPYLPGWDGPIVGS